MSYRRGIRSNQTGPNQFREYGPSRFRRRGYRSTGSTTCGNAVCLTFLGFALIIGSIIVQFTTEQNYITRLKDIGAIQKSVINLNNYNLFKSITASDPIYMTDTLHLSPNAQFPVDSQTGVTYKGFVMSRNIEMFQWIEKKSTKKESSYDGEEERTVTTYDYYKKWDTKYYSNSKFKYPSNHYNPQNSHFMNAQNRNNNYFWATQIMLGKYYISNAVRSLLTEAGLSWTDITNRVFNEYYTAKSGWNMKHGFIYYSEGYASDAEPNIGDVRVRWNGLDLNGYQCTFLGSLLNGERLNRFLSKHSNEFVYLKVGVTDSIAEVISHFHSDNAQSLMLWRIGTLVCMCIGFICVSSLVTYIVSWIPICGDCIGCALNLVACLVGLVFWCLFFVIAYVSARLVAIGLIVIILGVLFFMQKSAVGKDRDRKVEGESKTE